MAWNLILLASLPTPSVTSADWLMARSASANPRTRQTSTHPAAEALASAEVAQVANWSAAARRLVESPALENGRPPRHRAHLLPHPPRNRQQVRRGSPNRHKRTLPLHRLLP